MNEENFDPRQSLLLIESMINRAKDKFAEDGSMYLLWGWVVFVCSLTQFVLMHFFKYPYHYVVWFASWIIVIYQLAYIRKKIKRRRVRTYTGYILGYVWLTFVIVIFSAGIFDRQVDRGRLLHSYQPHSAYYLWHSYFFVRHYFKI
jgi:uncharacterized membrane protein